MSVSVKGTSRGTITDANGEYILDVEAEVTLIFSFVGYQPAEMKVAEQTVINIELLVDSKMLGEVTVVSTGYQEMDKRLFTGFSRDAGT